MASVRLSSEKWPAPNARARSPKTQNPKHWPQCASQGSCLFDSNLLEFSHSAESGTRQASPAAGTRGRRWPESSTRRIIHGETSGGGPFWTAVAERSGDTAFAPGGAEADGPGSRFARCQIGGAVRRLPDSATAVQSPPGPDPGSGHEPRPRTAPEVSGQSLDSNGFGRANQKSWRASPDPVPPRIRVWILGGPRGSIPRR